MQIPNFATATTADDYLSCAHTPRTLDSAAFDFANETSRNHKGTKAAKRAVSDAAFQAFYAEHNNR